MSYTFNATSEFLNAIKFQDYLDKKEKETKDNNDENIKSATNIEQKRARL